MKDWLEEIKSRLREAADGPWHVHSEPEVNYPPTVHGPLESGRHAPLEAPDDLEFMARARSDIPRLLTEVERLRKIEDAARAWHQAYEQDGSAGISGPACRAYRDAKLSLADVIGANPRPESIP